jgi:protein SCO1/2
MEGAMLTRREFFNGQLRDVSDMYRRADDSRAGACEWRGRCANYFPNYTLLTHDGREVRFYDDLIAGRIVALNMMYADRDGMSPPITANLVRVQRMLGDRVGRDIFMYSITLQPDIDTPEVLKAHADENGVGPGWLFLTGGRWDIEVIRRKLGFFDPDRARDRDKSTHTRLVRIGNDAADVWSAVSTVGQPEDIVNAILWMDVKSQRAREGQAGPDALREA